VPPETILKASTSNEACATRVSFELRALLPLVARSGERPPPSALPNAIAGKGRLAVPCRVSDADNRASRKVAVKAGFTTAGVLREHGEREGRRHDMVLYARLRSDPRPSFEPPKR